NADRCVGNPFIDSLSDAKSQIWYGQMSDGSYVVGVFNRNDNAASTTVNFADLGIEGEWNVRDLWAHADEGKASSITAQLAPHGCKIVKLTR
ncbi:MAG: glucan 1,6-alpha-isomaltosidase, partial [Muribaculaceae bacterium]|nr:glucan 1,6-alpha-isomaltosidase [Muribaculaceae bacterium]